MNKVEHFYDEHAEYEWNRLARHRMEFEVTLRAMAEYLPPAPARVLDIGGGPGRYSITLAKRGYRMTLLDLSAGLLEFARHKAAEEGAALEQIIHGNALDLAPLPDAAFDAVLLMGPLYHLLQLPQRQQAVREAHRVLKPGGVCLAAFINRYAPILDAAYAYPEWLMEDPSKAEKLLSTDGALVIDDGFVDAYFTHPSEVRPLMEGAGFQSLQLLPSEGLLSQNEAKVNALDEAGFAAWADLNYRIAKDPTVAGASEHLLWVGRKPS
jgi:ubiquinone/menaquinone biosynthesis C-methylase UbiE